MTKKLYFKSIIYIFVINILLLLLFDFSNIIYLYDEYLYHITSKVLERFINIYKIKHYINIFLSYNNIFIKLKIKKNI